MKDERVTFFRKALEGLVESLDATVRVARWNSEESVPEPLKGSASRLVERLGTADRLASGTFNGSVGDMARVKTMCGAMKRLDASYVTYRQATPKDRDGAAMTLDSDVHEIRADLERMS